MALHTNEQDPSHNGAATTSKPLPFLRSAVGGVLMGLANLVPGISGGTMIVVMGLYDEFIASVADVTRLRLTRRNMIFLGIVAFAAALAIAALSGTLSRAVILHPSEMFALFIGMTLAGVPLLVRMIRRPQAGCLLGFAVGLAVMGLLALTAEDPPDRDAVREAVAAGTFLIHPAYGRDVVAGVLGMSAMILPGISGAYMLLILGRYETILAAVSMAKSYVVTFGREGDLDALLRVLVPTALGAIVSLVFLSNILKWMLARHRDPMLGLLLGILLGSILGIWPFEPGSGIGDYAVGTGLAAVGFGATYAISRIRV